MVKEAENTITDFIAEAANAESEKQEISKLLQDLLVSIYIDQGKYEEALPLHQKVMEIHAQEVDSKELSLVTGYEDMGKILAGLGRYEEAIREFEKALTVWEEDGYMYLSIRNLSMIARCYQKLNNKEKAYETIQKTYKFRDITAQTSEGAYHQTKALFAKAEILEHFGDLEDAKANFEFVV